MRADLRSLAGKTGLPESTCPAMLVLVRGVSVPIDEECLPRVFPGSRGR